MILDFGSFTRCGLMVERVSPAETWRDKAWEEQRMQDQKGGGRRQRDHRPEFDGEVISSWTQLQRV